MWSDLRYGLRTLAGSPGYTAVAVISLTLGIGLATAAFSELNGFFLRDVPAVEHPGSLVSLGGTFSYPAYQYYRERTGVFSAVAAYRAPVPFGVWTGGRTERVWGHLVTNSYFATLGVQPAMGKFFEDEPEQPGQAPIAVVSYGYWRNKLGSDPAAVGRTLRINGQACTIAGVGPKDFRGASPLNYDADLWIPVWADRRLAPELADDPIESRDLAVFHVVGRLKPGISEERAAAELDTAARQLEQDWGREDRTRKGRRVVLLPGGKLLALPKDRLPVVTGFFTVLGGMILLIACANLANMSLARGSGRQREVAVRLAMGASRLRLIRQFLSESMLLAAGAGVVGFALAYWVMSHANNMGIRYPMPLTMHLEPDGRVLLFTLCLTLCTGFAFGILPALHASRADLTPALKATAAGKSRYRRLNTRNLLVVSQVAGSLALLTITATLVLDHRKIAGQGTGFDSRGLHLVSIDPIRDGISATEASTLMPALLERLRHLPSVSAAALADSSPMKMVGRPWLAFSTEGAGGTTAIRGGTHLRVGADYFDTMRIPILRGRGFRRSDQDGAGAVAIVSERLATECFPNGDALGRRVQLGNAAVPDFMGSGSQRNLPARARSFEIVGIARNVRDGITSAPKDAPPMIYVPLRPSDYAQSGLDGFTILMRTAPGVDVLTAARQEIAGMDRRLTPFDAHSMDEQIEELLFPVKVALYTYGLIGLCGLVLASVGLAGVTAYTVARRRREIGIRMAIGAQRADVLSLVMKEGVVLIGVGTLIGFLASHAGVRVLGSVMPEFARTAGRSGPSALLDWGTPVLLAALALFAAWLPARVAAHIDPVITLREE